MPKRQELDRIIVGNQIAIMRRMPQEYELEIWQNGKWCAGVSGLDWERVHAEAMRYAMVYGQDGLTEIRGIPMDKMDWLKSHLGGAGQ